MYLLMPVQLGTATSIETNDEGTIFRFSHVTLKDPTEIVRDYFSPLVWTKGQACLQNKTTTITSAFKQGNLNLYDLKTAR